MARQLIECVPNFSEGRDMNIIRQISNEIEKIEGVKLLDVDPGKATNRTVVTLVGEPEPVIEAAFRAIQKAAELIDMQQHQGEHPRFGATDVCPFIPIANITMKETAEYAHLLGKRVGNELKIPVYYYEHAAKEAKRKNLASVRAGEYEGIAKKIKDPAWIPDEGPAVFNVKSGNIAIGARDFLVAYNANLNTTSVRRANSVAFDIRENGRIKREGNPITGKIIKDKNGEPQRIPGVCKGVKAIGWYIEEYGIAQVSMNITNISITPVHEAFDACVDSAHKRGMRVTGSELVGLIPKKAMLDAGRYFLEKQHRSIGVSEEELIHIAVKSMGLDELTPFDPKKKIIEYMLDDTGNSPLIAMNLKAFSNETASESPAPGGGSISAYVGALGVSLATMVANLSSHKRGWDKRWKEFSDWAHKGQLLKDELLHLVDTQAFNAIMQAFQLPKGNDEEKAARQQAITDATKEAIKIPFRVMQLSIKSFDIIRAMAETGNPNSVSDAGVGALCARTAVLGAHLNVMINAQGMEKDAFVVETIQKAKQLADQAMKEEAAILEIVKNKIS